jgi:protein O-GlcNAc transferase
MNRKQRRAQIKTARKAGFSSQPDETRVQNLLGEAFQCHQTGRLAEAERIYREILSVDPQHADATHLLGVIAHQVGRSDIAVDLIGKAIEINGTVAAYHSNRGNALKDLGRLDEAIAAYDAAININPNYAEAHSNRGNALIDLGRLDEALAACDSAIRIKPGYAEAYSNRGNALSDLGRLDEALAAYDTAIRIKPDYAEAHYNRGNALSDLGRLDEALAAYDSAIRIKPNLAEAHCNRGNILSDLGRLDDALAACDTAIRIKPHYAEAQANRGNALKNLGRPHEAIAAYDAAIRIKPDFAEAHANRGAALNDVGRMDETLAAYDTALRIRPDYAEAHSNLLLCLNYSDVVSNEQIYKESVRWNEQHALQHRSSEPAYENERNYDRRLRLGYVSPDFRNHSVARFLEPLLRTHDHQLVEVFCYSDVIRSDAVTDRLRSFADHWLTTVGMSHDELADRIRKDKIDILIDLAGHTAKNRLPLFARRPAPVQVTWLGYPNTTGLAAIDYRLVDAVTDPSGEADAWASETLIRLEGGFLCYAGTKDAPPPARSPCLTTNTVTFGSFNNPAKLSTRTLETWARLLARVPKARLLLKGKSFADATACAMLLSRLAELGVTADRVELIAWLPSGSAHLQLYDRLDIALDPFPYNGTTTTCEALWMGVPIVTLRGNRHAGRVGASLLTQVGLTDWIASSVEDYIDIAVKLASDPNCLDNLRRTLRPRLAASPLCDGHAFSRKIESAYRSMWRQWCETDEQ